MNLMNRVELKVYNLLGNNTSITGTIYQGYSAPSTLSAGKPYTFIQRISSVSMDRTLNEKGGLLRRVRLQIDVYDKDYTKMVDRSEKIRDILSDAFPSCIDNDTYGTVVSGNSVWNVTSIDIILVEEVY